MFIVKLVDIAGDGLVTDFSSVLETLAEVEILIKGTLNTHLGVNGIELVHDEDLVYSVWLAGREIGIVSIRDVNSKPRVRK